MMQTQRSLRMLDGLSVLALLVAATVYFLPVNVIIPAPNAATTPALMPNAARTQANDNEAATVVSANILSSSRHVPNVRYTSPDLLPATDYSMPAAFVSTTNADSSKAATDAQDEVPSLYGIVNSEGSWRALVRLSDNDVSPTLLREGDRRGAYVVVSIRPNAVVVSGPSGQRTLRLNRASRHDSTGNLQ